MYDVARFWSRVKKTAMCWLFIGGNNGKGYGRLYIGGGRKKRRSEYAHRFAWRLKGRRIPKGKKVLHSCDVRNCVRDDHLFLGTAKDNSQDMARKGRQWLQKADQRTKDRAARRMRSGKFTGLQHRTNSKRQDTSTTTTGSVAVAKRK